jgi:hypothetical protein
MQETRSIDQPIIRRETNPDRINQVITQPEVHRWVMGIDPGRLDAAVAVDALIVLLGKFGGFLFWRVTPTFYEAQAAALPEGRGKWALRAAKRALKYAVGEVGEELQVCSVYFSVISGCLERQEPTLSEKYLHAAQRLGLLGATSKQSAGVSQEAYLAFSDVLFKDMNKSMGENCTNIAVLLKKL